MSLLAFPFAVQVAADCGGVKVNLRFTFDEIPTLKQLLLLVNDAFSVIYQQQRIHAIFDIGAAVVFNDVRCTWDRLENASQLYHTAQVYVFQPNLADTPAELPPPMDAAPFLHAKRDLPQRSPSRSVLSSEDRKSVSGTMPWRAPKLTIDYGHGIKVHAKPTPPRPEPKQYKEFIPGSRRLSVLAQANAFDEPMGELLGSTSTPKRFAVPPIYKHSANDTVISEGGGDALSPVPKYPGDRVHGSQVNGHPAADGARHLENHARKNEGSSVSPRASSRNVPDDERAAASRGASGKPHRVLLSPQRNDDDEDASPTDFRSRRVSAMTKNTRYDADRSSPKSDSAVRYGSHRVLSASQLKPAYTTTGPIRLASASPSTPPSHSRISVLSVSRGSYSAGAGSSPRYRTYATPQREEAMKSYNTHSPGVASLSLQEEREKLKARMNMPLEELRKSLQLEREEMERSLSRSGTSGNRFY